MSRYGIQELQTLFQAMDAELDQPVPLILIGGGAVILAYQGELYTHDLDTYSAVAAVQPAHAIARRKTGLDIPLRQAAVADAPYHFEDRLCAYAALPLTRLRLLIPEKHDLALMKMLRGDDHDIAHILEMAAHVGFDDAVFVTRFLAEMSHIVMDARRLEDHFLYMLAAVFGEPVAECAEDAINRDDTWLTAHKRRFARPR